MDVNTPRKKCVRCVEFYSKEGQKKDRNGTIIGFPLIKIIPISAAAVVTYLFVDPCCLDPIFQENIDRMRTDGKSIAQLAKDAHLGPVCVIRGRNCLSRCIMAEWSVTLGI